MKNANKILLVTGKNIDFDTYISLQLLTEVIKQDLGKEVELASETDLPKQYQAVFPMPEVKQMKELPPKSFVLEFKNQKNAVENIQWNQADDKLTLFLTMQQGDLNPKDFNFQVSGTNHDLIMLVGVNSFSELGTLYTNSRSIFDEARIVAFAKDPQIKQQNVKAVAGDKVSSLSEMMFNYLESNGIKITEQRADRVLTGIFNATKNFKQNVKHPQTYEIAARLTKLGATNESASSALAKTAADKAAQAKTDSQTASAPKPASPSAQQTAKPASQTTNTDERSNQTKTR